MSSERRSHARAFKEPGKLIIAIILSLLINMTFAAGIVALVMLFLLDDRHYGFYFLATLGTWLVLLGFRYVLTSSCACPLCRGPLMKNRNCEMHEKARQHFIFGYRFSMMLDAIFLGWFFCPYCGTSFRLRR
ncbi:MAG: hypothetical protein ACC661_05215 [Verrucomicrobiales bacterium]